MRKRILIIALMGILVGMGWSCSKEEENGAGREQVTDTGYREINEGDSGWEEQSFRTSKPG